MSTKVVSERKVSTDQARPSMLEGLKAATVAFARWDPSSRTSSAWAMTSSPTLSAVYAVSEKAAEAQRQKERVKSLASADTLGEVTDKVRQESIMSSVSLIDSFLTSPLPIPIASSGADGGATLFLDGDGFYGDLEIIGRNVEYYIKSNRKGSSIESYDIESIEYGLIPPKLLCLLFAHYARVS